jgi:hypothetical protein
MSTTANRGKQTTSSDPSNQKQIKLTLNQCFKGIRHRTTDNPSPKISERPGQEDHPMPVYGVNANFGIDFRHAVEFSRIGRTPRFSLSFEAPGQLAQLYCFGSSRSNRLFSIQSPCATQCPKPAEACFGFRDLQGVCRRAGRFRVLRFAPTRRTLLTFAVQMQIGVPDPRPSLPAPALGTGVRRRGKQPSSLWSLHSHASPRATLPSCRTHTSRFRGRRLGDGWETTRWEPVGSHLSRTAPPSRRLSASGRS